MTGSLMLDVSLLVAAQLLILLIPWMALHVVYIGDINPGRYGEQAGTFLRARLFLVIPATIALCWFGPRWLDTRHDVAIVLYLALVSRLVIATARFVRASFRDLTWIFTMVIGPLAVWGAVISVARHLATTDPSAIMWVFGGAGALIGPPMLVATAGWFAGRGSSALD